MATGGGKPWGSAFFGTVTEVKSTGDVTVGFPAGTPDVKVGDAIVLVPLPSAGQHPGGGSGEPQNS